MARWNKGVRPNDGTPTAGATELDLDTITALYFDETAERQRVISSFEGTPDEFTLDAVSTLADALDAVETTTYDCLVVEIDSDDAEPADVVAQIIERAPETPLVAYTRLDVSSLPADVIERVTTVVQKGGDTNRRFLATKIRGVLWELAGTDSRYDELVPAFADERGALYLRDSDGEVVCGSHPPETDEVLLDRLEKLFANGTDCRDRIEAAVAKGETVPGFVCEVPRPDGDSRYYTWWSVPVGNAGYRLELYREITDDIARRDDLETLETLVELANDGLSTLDALGRIKYANDSFADMLGVESHEVLGEYTYHSMDEGALRRGQRVTQEILEDPDMESRIVEFPYETADGHRIWLATRMAAIRNDDGIYRGLTNVSRDVTEQKRREQALRSQKQRLEETNEELESFAAVVSDGFRDDLRAAEDALEDVSQSLDADAIDRLERAFDAVEARIEDHLESVRNDRETDDGTADDHGTIGHERTNPTADSQDGTQQQDDSPSGVARQQDAPGYDTDRDDTVEDGAGTDSPEGANEDGTDSPEGDNADETDTKLTVLHLDADPRSREELAETIADEPDITVHSANTVEAALDAIRNDTIGCLVFDPTGFETDLDPFLDESRGVPLIMYGEIDGTDVDEQLRDAMDSLLSRGSGTGHRFLVEKIRSLTDIGHPDDVAIPWQSDRVETVGVQTDVYCAFVADGQAQGKPPSAGFFDQFAGDDRTLHEFLRAELANGDQFAKWADSEGPLLCELPTADDSHRFYRCWRLQLAAECEADAVECYLDVTAEVERIDRLRRARSLIEQARDVIWVLDERARLVYCNQATAELVGRSRDELIGNDTTAAMDETELQRGQARIQELIQNPEMEYQTVELDVIVSEDQRRTLSITFTLTPFDEDGSYTGVMAVGRDVTERKARQRELRQRRERLRRKNELLERFASVVSHDLRNPLTIATMYLEQAERTDDPSHLEKVREAIDRMHEMLDELLSFARMGGELGQRTSVRLGSVVREAWETTGTERAQIEMLCDSMTVEADEAKLLHVLENLFRNAREHGDQDVRVRVGRLDDGFYVADDGPGIPPDQRDRVFEYGFSSDGGTGIGLAIAKDVVTAHGWKISVTDSSAGGARFEITTHDKPTRNDTESG